MGKRILSVIICIAFLCLVLLSACGNKEEKVIRVGVRTDLTNFGYFSQDASIYYGYEIDLARQMAERAGYNSVEFIGVSVENREEMLLDREIDCLVAGMTPTYERSQIFDFSDEYYDNDFVFVALHSTLFTNQSDLKGKRIGVVNNSTAADNVKKIMIDQRIYDYELVKFDSYDLMFDYLYAGMIDSAATDMCYVLGQGKNGFDLTILEGETICAPSAVATLKDSEFSAPLNEAIRTLKEEGILDSLLDKWIGVDWNE